MRASLHRVSAYAGRCKLTQRQGRKNPSWAGSELGELFVTFFPSFLSSIPSMLLLFGDLKMRSPACAILSPGPPAWQRRFAASVEDRGRGH